MNILKHNYDEGLNARGLFTHLIFFHYFPAFHETFFCFETIFIFDQFEPIYNDEDETILP